MDSMRMRSHADTVQVQPDENNAVIVFVLQFLRPRVYMFIKQACHSGSGAEGAGYAHTRHAVRTHAAR